ncbi:MAG: SPFH domain-containing protein [Bacteroidales bacterium]|jgi:regulator of protease activity HflC (stomatin/prohibitin superfamily)|nr:SPFH domain-containing protein [Bacteroidales bacterium]
MNTKEKLFKGVKISGITMFIFNVLFLFGIIYCITAHSSTIFIVVDVVLLIIHCFIWGGFMQIEPNEARVMMFFGKYKGTVKDNGFFWVNPLYGKKKLTLRACNLDAEPIKVNDKMGNPVMIGQVIVWRIVDTYKISFDIEAKSYEQFVRVQSDAALRYVAGMYAYDNAGNDVALTLRSGGEELNDFLEKQLNERLDLAGIEILEARINYLAYAPEIAAVMLRRQQADAIISAREKIVEGAVGMVKQALQKLSDEAIIELDDDKKAAMVTNLLVVLCSDEPAQPVINSGTLHK